MNLFLEKLAKLIDVKSIVTIAMTIAMIVILLSGAEASKEVLMLFSSTYGAVITYFFTHKSEAK